MYHRCHSFKYRKQDLDALRRMEAANQAKIARLIGELGESMLRHQLLYCAASLPYFSFSKGREKENNLNQVRLIGAAIYSFKEGIQHITGFEYNQIYWGTTYVVSNL